ncbi:DUF4960 domain-containing protein [Pedobacter sp. GR22-10]|uniref:DUF4960 domain-containing protein n=1 Tax=Pedobacter sp. GR22-10 TaxID=2994472 RepID=UPI00224564FC|nr:DUF4960 domain-containing protein [Pedobacter sp. GR22-10]MCX2430753.1 DUF4960 domain-containing protein [Pedobacter sp. GR22-10]
MKLKQILKAFFAFVMALTILGCKKDKNNDFKLDSQVQLMSYSINGIAATIDQKTGAISVNVPFGTDISNLMPKLEMPDGATSSMNFTKPINFTGIVDFRVVNGNLFKDYSTTVKITPPLKSVSVGSLKASINHDNRTATLILPDGTDLAGIKPVIESEADVVVSPLSGTAQNFNQPVTYTFTKGNFTTSYQVTFISNSVSEYAFLGTASSRSAITNPDEKTASDWFFSTYPTADYISFGALETGKRFSNYKVIWWHFDSAQDLPTQAISTSSLTALKAYRNGGGSLLLTSFAGKYVEALGVVPAGKGPNNVFGDFLPNGFIENGSDWGISFKGKESHPLFQGLETYETGKANLLQKGTFRLNHTAWWFLPEWGGYMNGAGWRQQTGGINLASEAWDDNLDGRVGIAEWPQTNGPGNVVVITFGAYDWYSEPQNGAPTSNRFITNIRRLTKNAIDYLKK